jgi:hypothetical protein
MCFNHRRIPIYHLKLVLFYYHLNSPCKSYEIQDSMKVVNILLLDNSVAYGIIHHLPVF